MRRKKLFVSTGFTSEVNTVLKAYIEAFAYKWRHLLLGFTVFKIEQLNSLLADFKSYRNTLHNLINTVKKSY